MLNDAFHDNDLGALIRFRTDGNVFMFAMECASKLHKCGCSSFDVETINNEFRI